MLGRESQRSSPSCWPGGQSRTTYEAALARASEAHHSAGRTGLAARLQHRSGPSPSVGLGLGGRMLGAASAEAFVQKPHRSRRGSPGAWVGGGQGHPPLAPGCLGPGLAGCLGKLRGALPAGSLDLGCPHRRVPPGGWYGCRRKKKPLVTPPGFPPALPDGWVSFPRKRALFSFSCPVP